MTARKPPPTTADARVLARRAAEAALSKKAADVLILHVGELSPVADYFVLASGSSDPQVKAIVDAVEEALEAAGERPWHVEGRTGHRWVLLDYVHVVVHVFHESARAFYLLERLWGDAGREVVTEPPRAGTAARPSPARTRQSAPRRE